MGQHEVSNTNSHQMTIEERIKASESRIFKAVFPNTTNHYDTLFGGTAMHLMDEVAFITSTRFSRQRMVTVSSDKIDFTKPIPSGTIVELVGTVMHVGNTSLKVRVDVFIEEMYSMHREKAITGVFTFVAIDENKKPVPVIK
jgi:acyl-CoA hydrolase